MRRAALVAAVAVLAYGCATPPPPQRTTTVILLPDEDGHVGAVSVSSASGTRDLTEAWTATTVVGSQAPVARPADRDALAAGYDGLRKAQPPKPVSFILYFHLDRTTLTDESRAMIPAVVAAVRERKPTEITIFGHTDSIGTEKHNLKLSAERAHAVEKLLLKDDPSLDRIQVQYFGADKPLVNSGAKVEPRNRRAEVMIL